MSASVVGRVFPNGTANDGATAMAVRGGHVTHRGTWLDTCGCHRGVCRHIESLVDLMHRPGYEVERRSFGVVKNPFPCCQAQRNDS